MLKPLALCAPLLLCACASTKAGGPEAEPYWGALTDDRDPESLGYYIAELDARMRAWSNYKLTARTDRDLRTRRMIENELAEKTGRRFDELLLELASGPPANRTVAAMALGFSREEEALAPLLAALSDREDDVVANALLGLGLLASPNTPLAQPCFVLGSHPEGTMRINAAYCLQRMAEIGADDPCILDESRFALADTEPGVRAQCAVIVGRVGDDSDIERMTGLLDDEEPLVAAAALTAMSELGKRYPERTGDVARELVDAVGRVDRTLRGTVVRQLRYLSGEDFGQDLDAWRDWAYRLD